MRLLVLLGILGTPSAWGWGCTGHQVVAQLAYGELNAHARAESDRLLTDLSAYADLAHFCPPPALSNFGIVSTWADDLRAVRPETAPWHYIDIPLSAPAQQYPAYCDPKTGCVVSAIRSEVATLRSQPLDSAKATDVLILLIHFVGDIHQPLHDETNNDRGGNCLPVTVFGHTPIEGPNEAYPQNLHAVWDTQLVNELVRIHGGAHSLVAYLRAKYRGQARRWTSNMDYMQWAAEGHKKAFVIGYGRLPHSVPIEQPIPIGLCSDDNHVSRRLAALRESIDQSYVNTVAGTVEEQLAAAGFRLAAILNSIWP